MQGGDNPPYTFTWTQKKSSTRKRFERKWFFSRPSCRSSFPPARVRHTHTRCEGNDEKHILKRLYPFHTHQNRLIWLLTDSYVYFNLYSSYVARLNDEFERLVNAVHEPAVSPLEKTKSESAPLRCDIVFYFANCVKFSWIVLTLLLGCAVMINVKSKFRV